MLGVYRLFVSIFRRKNQIKHIGTMIANDRDRILNVSDDTIDAAADHQMPSLDAVRYTLFKGMRRELELALDGRSSEVTFDEIRQIRRVFVRDDLFKSTGPDRIPNNLLYYDNIFGDLENLKWLKLPNRGIAPEKLKVMRL